MLIERSCGEITSFRQSWVPRRRRPSRASRSRHDTASASGGPSCAIGSSRSFTKILDPREAIRRYLLRLAFSSVTLMVFTATPYDDRGLHRNATNPAASWCCSAGAAQPDRHAARSGRDPEDLRAPAAG